MEKVKDKFIMLLLLSKKLTPLPEKKIVTSEKVTSNEEADKGTKKLDDMEEPVVKICRKDLDNFEG